MRRHATHTALSQSSVQWNLSIKDTLNKGHLSNVDTLNTGHLSNVDTLNKGHLSNEDTPNKGHLSDVASYLHSTYFYSDFHLERETGPGDIGG